MLNKHSQNLYKYLLLVQNSFFLKNYLNLALFTYGINLYDVELAIKSNFFRKANFFLLKSSFYRLNIFRDLMVRDTLSKSSRFLLVYNYLSVKYSLRCFITLVEGNNSYIFKSINSLYSSSIWVEREAWDMFGVWFIDNVDMRRILTDYGFQGHPLRKDFPLSGFKEISYKESFKRLVYSNVVLSQEYRFFHFSSHWRLA